LSPFRWTFDDSLNGFTITAMRTIERGEQVYDSYGRKCNSRFFVNYGFALEDNEEDNEALMQFACPPDAPALAIKTRLAAGKNILALREFQVPATSVN
jgi:histone-lysine N-methyltransferase SETD3